MIFVAALMIVRDNFFTLHKTRQTGPTHERDIVISNFIAPHANRCDCFHSLEYFDCAENVTCFCFFFSDNTSESSKSKVKYDYAYDIES